MPAEIRRATVNFSAYWPVPRIRNIPENLNQFTDEKESFKGLLSYSRKESCLGHLKGISKAGPETGHSNRGIAISSFTEKCGCPIHSGLCSTDCKPARRNKDTARQWLHEGESSLCSSTSFQFPVHDSAAGFSVTFSQHLSAHKFKTVIMCNTWHC